MLEVASFIWIQAVSAAGTCRRRIIPSAIYEKAPDARASGAFKFLSVGFFFWQRALSFLPGTACMFPTHAQYLFPTGNPENAPCIFQDTAHSLGIKKTPTA